MQLAGILRDQIARGEIRDRVPSLTQLAADHGVAINTVARAFRQLKDEGLIYTVRGRGTFVRREE